MITLYIVNVDGSSDTIISKGELDSMKSSEYNKLLLILENDKNSYTDFNNKNYYYSPITWTKRFLILPRFGYQHVAAILDDMNIEYKIQNTIPFNEIEKFYLNMKLDVWENNLKVTNYIWELLQKNNGIVLKFDTGCGKTVILSKLVQIIGKKTVIIVKNRTLQQQLFNDLHENIHLDGCKYTKIEHKAEINGQQIEDYEMVCDKCRHICMLDGKSSNHNKQLLISGNYKILICVINSALKKPMEFWKQFELSIYDECQNYTTEIRATLYNKCVTKYVLGMSANPEKPWNKSVIKYNIGKLFDADKLMGKRDISGTVYVVRNTRYIETLYSKSKKVSIPKIVKSLMDDKNRCNLVVDILRQIIANEGCAFVFGLRNDFIKYLYEITIEADIPNCMPVVLNADSSDSEKFIARKKANVIFTNYAFSEGLNIPRFRYMIIASPYKTNGVQIIGRILRGEFSKHRTIYDIVDTNCVVRSQYSERKKVYEEKNFKIKEYSPA